MSALVARAVTILLALAVIIHSSFLVAYNLPFNPLTSPHQAAIDRYMLPVFFQQWGFFAPTPGGWYDEAFVRYRIKSAIRDRQTDWINLNSALPASYQQNPLSPLSIDRDVFYSILIAVNDDTLDLQRFGSMDQLDRVTDTRHFSDQERALERLAFALGPALCAPIVTSSQEHLDVQLSVSRRPFPHYSERFKFGTQEHDKYFSSTTIVRFPWVRAENVNPIYGISACGN